MTATAQTAYIGLGSNLESPLDQINSAFDALKALPKSHLKARSKLYGSAPVGPGSQPDYVNAVAAISTTLTALELLDALQVIENQHHRERSIRWGPRTLDLDILMFGHAVIDHPRLQVPHPQLQFRNFVLYPLADIQANLVIPLLGPLQELIKHSSREGLWTLTH